MLETWLRELEAWHDFYVLLGTAAATLMALMFVVVTLGPKVIAENVDAGVRAFFSPTTYIFASILLVSLAMLVPHIRPWLVGIVLLVCGGGAVAHLCNVRTHHQWRESQLGLEDWAFYVGLPFAGYGLLFLAGATVLFRAMFGLPVAAAGSVLLLIIAIRNAWDIVLWIPTQTDGKR